MGLSLLCFLAAYAVRRANNRLHRAFALAGILLNILSSVYLVYAVRIFGIEMPARFAEAIVVAHRIFSAAIEILMLAMLYSGLKRQRQRHIMLHYFFLPGYTLSYISGLVIFFP